MWFVVYIGKDIGAERVLKTSKRTSFLKHTTEELRGIIIFIDRLIPRITDIMYSVKPVNVEPKDRHHQRKTKMRTIMCFKRRELANELPELENVTTVLAKLKLQTTEVSTPKNDALIKDNEAKTDSAVVINEALWWKQVECAALRRSSVSFFTADHESETAVSKWERARIRAAKIGKGSSKDEKAQKLVLLHWLEAIDPLHRYGGNLHPYCDVWLESESNQPFFYWLDIGDGKDVSLQKCSRANLQLQCIKYLGPKEREAYEVVMEKGKLVYKQSRVLVDTPRSSQWIFVLGTSRDFYVGEKKKGFFQHSSFLAGAATMASGRLVAHNGILQAIWPLSGHYRPTEEHFKEFCSFLEDHHIDLTNVKKFDIDEDIAPKVVENKEPIKSEKSEVLTDGSIDEAKVYANEMNKDEESMKGLEESAAGSEDSIVKKLNSSPTTLACLGLSKPIHLSNSKELDSD